MSVLTYKAYSKHIPQVLLKNVASVVKIDDAIVVRFNQPVPTKENPDKYLTKCEGKTWEEVVSACNALDAANTLRPESWSTIEREYHLWNDFSCRPTKSKLPETHVFDEEKSVRWNREMVKEHNEAVDKEVVQLNRRKNELRDIFAKHAAVNIQSVLRGQISHQKALAIVEYAYKKSDKYFKNIISEINSIVALLAYMYDQEDTWNQENILDYWEFY